MDLGDHPASGRLLEDVAHLRDLWDMLPARRDEKFWQAMSDLSVVGEDYFTEKAGVLSIQLPRMVEAGGAETLFGIQHVVQYVLVLFDRDHPSEAYALLDRVVHYGVSDDQVGRAGRRWLDDLIATAWRLYVAGWADGRRTDRFPPP